MTIIVVTFLLIFLALLVFSLCKSSKMGEKRQELKIIVITEGEFEVSTQNSFQELENQLNKVDSPIKGYILEINE